MYLNESHKCATASRCHRTTVNTSKKYMHQLTYDKKFQTKCNELLKQYSKCHWHVLC